MKNRVSSRYRSLLVRGGAVCAVSILLLCGTGCHDSKDTDKSVIQPTTTEVSTSCTTSTATSTTTSSTTSSTTTSATTTVATMTTTEPMTQKIVSESTVQIEPVYVEPTTTWDESELVWTSEDDVILLARLINHEASATYEGKVMVGSCVVNRMNATGMSVSEVIFEPYQFTTASSLTDYTEADYQAAQQVLTQGSADTRIYFFDGCHPDGLNHFRDINDNYIGAW